MTLEPGRTLGRYEILGLHELHGTSQTYRARDTRLGRDVALEALDEELRQDERGAALLLHEAWVLAALDHPGVIQVFDVDRIEGRWCLVLELLPGESLRERLGRGALPVGEALSVCRQVSGALTAAHTAGIVHRDVKPAHVQLLPDGGARLKGFRLAQSIGLGRVSVRVHGVLPAEADGLVGTPAYMAPEQARGEPVDSRADAWAFGHVLFECLAGRRACARCSSAASRWTRTGGCAT